jgi:aspartate aminotransferase
MALPGHAAVTGWRMGFVAGPQAIIDAIEALQSHSTSHTSSITQAAVLPAYDGSVDMGAEVARMVAAFRERRDLIGELLTSIPGVSLTMPDGAFYVFPDISRLLGKPLACGVTCHTDEEFAAASARPCPHRCGWWVSLWGTWVYPHVVRH